MNIDIEILNTLKSIDSKLSALIADRSTGGMTLDDIHNKGQALNLTPEQITANVNEFFKRRKEAKI